MGREVYSPHASGSTGFKGEAPSLYSFSFLPKQPRSSHGDRRRQRPPAFTLKDQNGEKVALKDLKGQNVVIYFYPKDDTPGCTKEACGFRDLWGEIQGTGTVVLGVSPDDGESHERFICKYSLPFTLLCDPDKKVMEKYGAWGEKNMYGKKTVGVIRSTVIVGKDGEGGEALEEGCQG